MYLWLVLASLWYCGLTLTCLDPNGNNVDWYSVYKAPKLAEFSDWMFRDGLANFYLDVHSPKWSLSPLAMNESQTAVANTLNQIYNSQDILYLMYNDELPASNHFLTSHETGHTKGVVAFDAVSGFWLIHSAPKFPLYKSEGNKWPKTASVNGQTFLCVSLPYQQLGILVTQLLYNQPHVYDSFTPPSFLHDFPNIKAVIQGKSPSGPPWYSVQTLTSASGQNFISFAKSYQFEADLYDALVAPTLKQDLLVESWLRSDQLGSNCSAKYRVQDITYISLPMRTQFSETKDHSKWAITFSTGNEGHHFRKEKAGQTLDADKWICIGDINRMYSQFKRGGGTLCLPNADVWMAFKNSVYNYSSC